jgi:hypothetical protein
MPPKDEEILTVQQELFSRKLAEDLASIMLRAKNDEERARSEGRTFTSAEERIALLSSAAEYAVIAELGPLFRYWVNHLPENDWNDFRAAASEHDEQSLGKIMSGFMGFRQTFIDAVSHADPDAYSALVDDLEKANDPEAYSRALAMVEKHLEQLFGERPDQADD